MPQITVGPNTGGFAEAARILQQGREAAIQQALQRQELNSRVAEAQADRQLRAQLAEQQMAAQAQAREDALQQQMVENEFRRLEQERRQAAFEAEHGANALQQAIQTGVKLDPSGQYRALRADDVEYQPWQESVRKSKAADERLRLQNEERARQWIAEQQMAAAAQGIDFQATPDPATGQMRYSQAPLTPDSPLWGVYERARADFEAKRPRTVEEQTEIERAKAQAKYDAEAPEREAKARKAASDKADKLRDDALALSKDIDREAKAINKAEADEGARWSDVAAAHGRVNALKKAAGPNPSKKEADAIDAAQKSADALLAKNVEFVERRTELEARKQELRTLKAKVAAAEAEAAGQSPNVSRASGDPGDMQFEIPTKSGEKIRLGRGEFSALVERDPKGPNQKALGDIWTALSQGDPNAAITIIAKMPPEIQARILLVLRQKGVI